MIDGDGRVYAADDSDHSDSDWESYNPADYANTSDSDPDGAGQGPAPRLTPREDEAASSLPTHVTLTAGAIGPNPLTIRGREILGQRVGVDRLTAETEAIRTVTIRSDVRGFCNCGETFNELSDEAKSLELEMVVLHHNHSGAAYDRDCPLLSYRYCLTDGKIPLRSKTFMVLNEMNTGLPITFITSTQGDGGEVSTACNFDDIVAANDESVHIGFVSPIQRERTESKAGPVVPVKGYRAGWEDMTIQSAPRTVSIVDVSVDSRGKHPNRGGSTISSIDENATLQRIEATVKNYSSTISEKHGRDGSGTQYSFVDRETFDGSHAGRKLAAYFRALRE